MVCLFISYFKNKRTQEKCYSQSVGTLSRDILSALIKAEDEKH